MIRRLILEKNISLYRLSKESGVAYTTISELVNRKTHIKKCNAKTVYMLAKYFDVTMESLIENDEEDKNK